MNDTTAKLLEDLAGKLGTTAEYLWSVLVRQAFVSFWMDILFYVIAFVFSVIAVKGAIEMWKLARDADMWSDAEFGYQVGTILCCIISTVLVLVSVFSIEATITKIANPEYYALNQIMSAVRGK